jgi:hypothetical protein
MPGPGNPDSFEFEKVSMADARKALDDAVRPAGGVVRAATNWDGKRKPVAAETLRTATVQWILKLPPHVQPRHLQVKYPRIANRIAALWDDQTSCESFMDDLLTDKRGGRKGFPLNVAQELASLRDYHFRLHHKDKVAWDHVEW